MTALHHNLSLSIILQLVGTHLEKPEQFKVALFFDV